MNLLNQNNCCDSFYLLFLIYNLGDSYITES